MLRITQVRQDARCVVLRIEGRIVREWADTLESECRRWLECSERVLLDFEQVTYVDARGVAMWKRIRTQRVEIIHCPVNIRELLGDHRDV